MCGGSFLIVNNVAALKRYQDSFLLWWLIVIRIEGGLREPETQGGRAWGPQVPIGICASRQCLLIKGKSFLSDFGAEYMEIPSALFSNVFLEKFYN